MAKVLYPNNYMNSVEADEEDGSYPIENVEDDNTQKIWKATSNDAVVKAMVTAGATAVVVFNTNATSIGVVTRQSLGLDWQAASELDWQSADASWGIDWVEQTAITETYDISASDIGQLWADFTTYAESFVVELTFTAAAGTTIQAGVIQCGIPKVYNDPQYVIPEGFKDYSIVKELNSGGFYVRKRSVARKLSFRLLEDRDVDFYEFMYQVVQVVGPGPLAWRIVHDTNTDWEWIIFALFDGELPQGSHDYPKHSYIDVNLIEAI